jgi:hypothetical protein
MDAQGRSVKVWERSGAEQEYFSLGALSAGWYVVLVELPGGSQRHTLQIQP